MTCCSGISWKRQTNSQCRTETQLEHTKGQDVEYIAHGVIMLICRLPGSAGLLMIINLYSLISILYSLAVPIKSLYTFIVKN